MEPIRELMASKMNVAGADWEREQQGLLAKALQEGRTYTREYRATLAAKSTFELECLRKLRVMLSTGAIWDQLPSRAANVSTRSLILRMCSREGCLVHQLLITMHKHLNCY